MKFFNGFLKAIEVPIDEKPNSQISQNHNQLSKTH